MVTILMDLTDVLIQGMDTNIKSIEEKFGERAAQQFGQRMIETDRLMDDVMRDRLMIDEFFELFLADFNWPFTAQDLKAIFCETMGRSFVGTLEVLKNISSVPIGLNSKVQIVESGKPVIYIASDHCRQFERMLRKAHPEIFELASGTFWSWELGRLKKDKRFFLEIKKRLGEAQGDLLLIDNSLANCESARRAGISYHQFIDAARLENSLASIGFGF